MTQLKIREDRRMAKKSPKRKPSTKRKSSAARKRPRPHTPRLPGVEVAKDAILDRVFKSIADERHAQAESRATEASVVQAAHKRMQALGWTTYKAHGVEGIRVPGDEKFRVRTSKDGGEERGDDLRDEGDASGEELAGAEG